MPNFNITLRLNAPSLELAVRALNSSRFNFGHYILSATAVPNTLRAVNITEKDVKSDENMRDAVITWGIVQRGTKD